MRSLAQLERLPEGNRRRATPLLPALHARAVGVEADAAVDAEATVLAEWLVSEQELRTPPPLPPCGARDPARRSAVTGPRRGRDWLRQGADEPAPCGGSKMSAVRLSPRGQV